MEIDAVRNGHKKNDGTLQGIQEALCKTIDLQDFKQNRKGTKKMEFCICNLKAKQEMAKDKRAAAEQQLEVVRGLLEKVSLDDPQSIKALQNAVDEKLTYHIWALEELQALEEARKLAGKTTKVIAVLIESENPSLRNYNITVDREEGLVYFAGELSEDGAYRNDFATVPVHSVPDWLRKVAPVSSYDESIPF
ncbi:MAG: hypothetical protein HQK62_07285 [Desulfamplus sp.]|nr:hypothetical protein [Desulfamplus sp.]